MDRGHCPISSLWVEQDMKQFFTALAANLVTIAVCVVALILLVLGVAASAGTRGAVEVRPGSILVVDLDQPLADQASRTDPPGLFDEALSAGMTALPLRSTTLAIRAAADDDRISGILLRGTVASDGVSSGYAALRELRGALQDFKASKKPVHAYLVTPDVSTYYVASAADSITLDPFGSLLFPGMASEQVFLSGLFEKYGIGVQVSRVGRFKAAVEPFTRRDMSPENRLQVAGYLGDLWSEVKRGVADSRSVDTLALQQQADAQGIILPPMRGRPSGGPGGLFRYGARRPAAHRERSQYRPARSVLGTAPATPNSRHCWIALHCRRSHSLSLRSRSPRPDCSARARWWPWYMPRATSWTEKAPRGRSVATRWRVNCGVCAAMPR